MRVRNRINCPARDLDQEDEPPTAGKCDSSGAHPCHGVAERSAPQSGGDLMREFLVAAAVSAIIIGVMLGVG